MMSNVGMRFVSDCMAEVSNVFNIKRLIVMPYHPACIDFVEKFNRTLKKMLQCLYKDQPHQWNFDIMHCCVLIARYLRNPLGILHLNCYTGGQFTAPKDLEPSMDEGR